MLGKKGIFFLTLFVIAGLCYSNATLTTAIPAKCQPRVYSSKKLKNRAVYGNTFTEYKLDILLQRNGDFKLGVSSTASEKKSASGYRLSKGKQEDSGHGSNPADLGKVLEMKLKMLDEFAKKKCHHQMKGYNLEAKNLRKNINHRRKRRQIIYKKFK